MNYSWSGHAITVPVLVKLTNHSSFSLKGMALLEHWVVFYITIPGHVQGPVLVVSHLILFLCLWEHVTTWEAELASGTHSCVLHHHCCVSSVTRLPSVDRHMIAQPVPFQKKSTMIWCHSMCFICSLTFEMCNWRRCNLTPLPLKI